MTLNGFTSFLRVLSFSGSVLLLAFALLSVVHAQSFSIRSMAVASNSDDLLAVDLNHDFLPDLVLVDRDARGISVYLNSRGGAFSSPIKSSLADVPVSIDSVDVNEDGHMDLIMGLSSHSSFLLYTGNGNGTFLPPRPYSVAGWPVSVSVRGNRGFPTEGGSTDVVSVSIDRLSIAFGRPQDTTFVEGATIFQLTEPGQLTHGLYADINNDGSTDVIFGQCCGNGTVPQTTLSLMTATPGVLFGFSSPQKIAQLNRVQSLVVGDIRQDGNTGFMATFGGCSGSGCQGVMLFTGLGNGSFKQTRLEVPASNYDVPLSPQLIDYNGDGLADIAVAVHHRVTSDGSAPHDAVLIWTAKSDGTYRPFVEIKLPTNGLESTSNAASLRTADLNADGRPDLVVGNSRSNSITILLNRSQQATECSPRTDGPSVVTCTPTDGSTIDATDLKINCATTLTGGCRFYIDGVLMNQTRVFEQSFLVPPGKHVVVAKAWDDGTGFHSQTVRHITMFNHYLASCPPGANETVNFCLPARDGTAISPVRVLATGSSASVITGTNIYVDSFLVARGGMFVDARLTLSNGTHRIVAKSWNRNGASFFSTRNVMVDSQQCPVGPLFSLDVCSPTSGESVTSAVHVEAIANSDVPVTGWRVYLSGKSIFGSFGGSNLSIDLVLPKGDQTLVFKAWDAQGRIVGTTTRTINVM